MMKSDKGMTLLEALVSTVIIGIGFVAVFQMVNYSIRSIDVSSDRTKANYLVSMVAEDLISEKNADSGDSTNPKLKDYLDVISTSIGVRQQNKIPRELALYLAKCRSTHQDLSLYF